CAFLWLILWPQAVNVFRSAEPAEHTTLFVDTRLARRQCGLHVWIVADFLSKNNVSALALLLYTRGKIHGGAEVVENLVQVDGDARPMVYADLQCQGRSASCGVVFVDALGHLERRFDGFGRSEA